MTAPPYAVRVRTSTGWQDLALVGPQGPPGPAGGGGGTGGSFYEHNQATPATTWTVTHNLGYHPNVAPVDSLNREFIADVTHTSLNTLTITLTAATSGKAYLS